MYYFGDEFETVKKTICRCCESKINRGDWAFEDGYRNVFCSIECVKEYHEIKETTLEDLGTLWSVWGVLGASMTLLLLVLKNADTGLKQHRMEVLVNEGNMETN